MQQIGDWADTSGSHLNSDGLGGAAEARFDTWWNDDEAQELIRQLVVSEPGSLSFTDELDVIRTSFIEELPWNEYNETYYADLVYDTPDADEVDSDPVRFLYMRELAA